jgi:hypothetical protein
MLGPTLAVANDQEIANQIVEKLQHEKAAGNLKGFSIDLQVEEGTVWMSGRVNAPEHQAKALDIARRVPGVKQVVNDLEVVDNNQESRGSTLGSMTAAVKNAVSRGGEAKTMMASQSQEVENRYASGQSVLNRSAGPVGTGVDPASAAMTAPPAMMPSRPMMGAPHYPAHASQIPLAYSQARSVSQASGVNGEVVGTPGMPVPFHAPGSAAGVAPARYDHPQLPGYSWPTYAAYPNYAAVTYPKQYSPTAWPYIGPFYPYPQVPLGWRKVTLEWDDGWWQLDFKDRRHWSRKWD